MWELGLLAFGLAGLWIGTEVALRATLGLTERWGLSQAFLGMTLLAIGTDLPELVVAIDGGTQQLRGIDASGVVVGNAVGSAIAQGTLVLGTAGLVGLLQISRRSLRRDVTVLGLAMLLLGVLAWDGTFSRLDGLVLVIGYAIYLGSLIATEWPERSAPSRAPRALRGLLLGVVGGIAAVLVSAELVVTQALALAERWQLSQGVVGVLIVGAGTSLPELVLSIGAAAKGRAGLSVGNVVGSNVFDLLVPIGASSLIAPLAATPSLAGDLGVLALATAAMTAVFVWRTGLQRPEAVGLVALWLVYAAGRLALD